MLFRDQYNNTSTAMLMELSNIIIHGIPIESLVSYVGYYGFSYSCYYTVCLDVQRSTLMSYVKTAKAITIRGLYSINSTIHKPSTTSFDHIFDCKECSTLNGM